MLWDINGIKVFMDVTTYCNAGCPQCHRTSMNGLGKQDWVPLVQWDLEMFQKAFPPKQLEKVATFKFCGTWGDPVMCKDLDKIYAYIIDNSFARISMDTNGSIRNSDWWWDLGIKCGRRLTSVFDIDGINQEMHEKYRRFTSLEKVLENMEMLSHTRAQVESQTILFKHNQDYQEEIKKLAGEHGSKCHSFVISDRFNKWNSTDGKSYFTTPEGTEEYLEEADREKLPDGKISGTNSSKNEYQIKCRWALPRNEVVVNPDGQVLPCCFHANAHYAHQFQPTIGKELYGHPIYMEEYNQNLKKYNVLYTPFDEIVSSDWYQKRLPGSMLGDNPVRQCEMQCSNRVKDKHQLRNMVDITQK